MFFIYITNIYNTEPTKFPYAKNRSVYHDSSYGPYFGYGADLGFSTSFGGNSNWSNFPYSYKDVLGKGRSIFTGDFNNNNKKFKLKEIEIFKLS